MAKRKKKRGLGDLRCESGWDLANYNPTTGKYFKNPTCVKVSKSGRIGLKKPKMREYCVVYTKPGHKSQLVACYETAREARAGTGAHYRHQAAPKGPGWRKRIKVDRSPKRYPGWKS